ncbi:uncharacterized protein LOC104880357 isoform X1 [Vitis vinifera]|uniref:uncharacterized protein LOC104880357 isoform X1 n=1 Tax=Vitis vinifera TaxID=29760 RepID=UPI00288313F3|nr:uncharacterized protein LOC104880357 isoform X1 [Vitis vinifera]XP_059595663.1 uncharacterized protein LOC104880357 isoform X1 [Vitis vinifera]XP_059595664.1 uncharacterized protein LOC104880357 isoform X1 [Vitis vinifera]XP_059595665.1 uncharacterized protein LOC104880357 isoform X1 [Vitis vinifera]
MYLKHQLSQSLPLRQGLQRSNTFKLRNFCATISVADCIVMWGSLSTKSPLCCSGEGGSDKGGRGAEQANGCFRCSSDQGGESLVGFRAAGGGGSGPAERWLDHQDNGRRPKGIFLGTRNSNINFEGHSLHFNIQLVIQQGGAEESRGANDKGIC